MVFFFQYLNKLFLIQIRSIFDTHKLIGLRKRKCKEISFINKSAGAMLSDLHISSKS